VGLHVKYRLFLSVFKETSVLSLRFSKNSSDIKFHKNPYSGSRIIPCGRMDRQTDRHDEANNLYTQFCELALKKEAGGSNYAHREIPQ